MLLEARVKNADLIEKLENVPLGRMYHASFRALMRLQIFFTGRTSEMFLEFGDQARAIMLKHADSEGVLDGIRGFRAQDEMLKAWGKMMAEWTEQFQAAREAAGMIPFGVLAVSHNRLVVDSGVLTESGQRSAVSGQILNEAVKDGVFNPQLQLLLNVASQYLYGDGATLDNRIWNLENAGRDAINDVIMNGIANGSSALDMAKELEQFLGANEDCPRWTKSRLYNMSVSDRATSTSGLLNGNPCDGSGVSYKALRLARTEIQKIHSLATDKIMAMQPWVEGEQCNLSAAHKERDECDDVVEGGENADGVYPKGTIEYPLHPNCFCFKTAVLMDQKEFTTGLRDWLNGGSWAEMDQYASDLGVDLSTDLTPVSLTLAVWLFGEDLALSN
jgi:hypothetical protein